eukprot:1152275-Pelagomonas_calceolata.AAC.7
MLTAMFSGPVMSRLARCIKAHSHAAIQCPHLQRSEFTHLRLAKYTHLQFSLGPVTSKKDRGICTRFTARFTSKCTHPHYSWGL